MYKIVVFCALLPLIKGQKDAFTVQTNLGAVRGAKANDGDFLSFYGIRYAGSTTGTNRFKTAPPAQSHSGVFLAEESGIVCAQPTKNGIIGVEDCLKLDIHTPHLNLSHPGTLKPVMVWLTGDEYTTTSNPDVSFKALVEKGILVIRLNYRLSIFGFLCLGVADAPGNAGLKDVIQGLKWIGTNIEHFGGNPKNVVLFGHGSGAAMVDLITMSPHSQGLIHKAIALSGSALAPWALAYEPVQYAEAVGDNLGYDGKSREDLAKHLLTTDIFVLASSLGEFKPLNNTPLFAPCIENAKLNPNDTFLEDAPINILRGGNYDKDIPYLTGYMSQEGTVRAGEAAYGNWLSLMQNNFTNFLPVDLELREDLDAVQSSIRQFYFGHDKIEMGTIARYLEYHGDTMYLVPTIRSAFERAVLSKVYLFEFAYKGSLDSDWVNQQIPLTGAQHGVILKFLLDYDLKLSDRAMATRIMTHFVNFTATGAPSGENHWTPTSIEFKSYIIFSGEEYPSNVTTAPEATAFNPHSKKMNFWNELYSKYNKTLTPVSSSGKILALFSLVVLSQVYLRFL